MTIESGSTCVPNHILRDPRLSAPARLLYSILKSYAWQTDNAFPGQLRLADEMGCSDRMVRSYLSELEDSGLITVEQRGKTITNRYFLTDEIKGGWKPISASDRKRTSTHDESDRKQASAVTGSTLPLVTGSRLPTNKTQGNKTQTNKTQQPPLPPKEPGHLKEPLVVDEKAKALKTLRALIARPNEQFINGGTNAFMHRLVDTYPVDWFDPACELAAGSNASLTYVKAILEHWKNHAFKCECRNPKAAQAQPIPIQQRTRQSPRPQPQMSPWGVPYSDPVNTFNPSPGPAGTYGVDYVWGAKEA